MRLLWEFAYVPKGSYRNQMEDEDESITKPTKGNLHKICISCYDEVDIDREHPLFEGGICLKCEEDYIGSTFSFGQDGTPVYCVICSYGGEMYVCSNTACLRAYCTRCVRDFLGEAGLKRVQNTNHWLCFMCSKWKKTTHGLLHGKEGWYDNILRIIQGPSGNKPEALPTQCSRALRVLSVTDSLDTVLLALDQLGVPVDAAYMCTELDEDGQLVARARHPSLIQLGDISNLSERMISKICPLDLIIGVSSQKKTEVELHKGLLFFHFHRLLRIVQLMNDGCHLHWLYANTTPQAPDVMERVNRFVRCQPVMWEILDYSKCCLWGNLPNMHNPLYLSSVPLDRSQEADVMAPYQALIEKVEGIVRTHNIEASGTLESCRVYQNQGDPTWVGALERTYGFPEHYTDVGNLNTSKRQKLIRRALPVTLVKHLITPLHEYFKSNGTTAEPDQV